MKSIKNYFGTKTIIVAKNEKEWNTLISLFKSAKGIIDSTFFKNTFSKINNCISLRFAETSTFPGSSTGFPNESAYHQYANLPASDFIGSTDNYNIF